MLSHIQAYLRHAASYRRETRRIGPFLATFDPAATSPYLSYAIPDEGAVPHRMEIVEMVAAYADRNRTPRLEYLPALAPEAEPALLAAGFTVEARIPIMACRPADALPQPTPDGIELLVPRTDDEFAGLITVQREAFADDEPVTPAAVDRLRTMVADGALAVLARDTTTGAAAGAGGGSVIVDGSTELVGLAVREAYRRRGIAAAVTGELSRLADQAGVTTAFLTPGGDVAERVYAGVGYHRIGGMLHISLTSGSAG
jgi:ribosomal protein S18 acetylase RimI-like enzyme